MGFSRGTDEPVGCIGLMLSLEVGQRHQPPIGQHRLDQCHSPEGDALSCFGGLDNLLVLVESHDGPGPHCRQTR